MALGIAMPISLSSAAGVQSASHVVTSSRLLTYNTHIFGRTGSINGVETGLVLDDDLRTEQIAMQLRQLRPDVVGLTEMWDDELRGALQENLQDIYPYQVRSPNAGGIPDIIESLHSRWPRATQLLLDNVEDIVEFFAQTNYNVDRGLLRSAFKYFIKEDWMHWGLKEAFRLPDVWGSGLLILSRYPLSDAIFYPYQARADAERFARKGTLKADVNPPGQKSYTVYVTHAQQGESLQAITARKKQLEQIRALVEEAIYPAVVMGDLNDVRYRWMARKLGLVDSFRLLHPDEQARPGYTYDHNNRFAVKFGVKGAPNEGKRRIDYIYTDGVLQAKKSRVRREEFRDPRTGHDSSDHFAVETEIAAPA